jgi:ATP-binding cassette subfamily B protein
LAEQAAGIDVDKKQTNYLWTAGAKMLLVALLMAATTVLVCLFAAQVGAGVGRDLRGRIYEKVMRFSDAEMNRFSTASLITRSTNDVQQIQMVATMLLRMIIYAPILGIGGIIKVIQTGSGMGWIIVLAVVLVVAVVLILLKAAMPKFKIMQKLVDRINLVSREILTGLSVIRAFGREKKEEERFEDANVALTKNMLFTNRVMTFMMPCMMFIMYGISILIVWVSADKIDQGTIQVGTMTAFITYAMQIVMSFLMLTMLSVMAPRAAVAAERMDEVLATEVLIRDAEDAEETAVAQGVIRFENVSFAYPGSSENVIDNISFTAETGQVTAVIGGTGSGKSTLVNLIPRFYDVTSGRILVDGKDIRSMAQKSLRAAIGYVPQKGVLFSGTIASNLRYGKEDATQEQIEEAIAIAQAKEIVDGKEDGYNSPIAQGGSNVSGGQKQRFSIARAIVKEPKIYIFDDSFSALDYKTDAMLRKELAKKTKNATVLIVAQRISTILHADQIIVLEEGKIAGIGTHQQLMESCSVYQEIAASQLSESDLSQLSKEGKEGRKHE